MTSLPFRTWWLTGLSIAAVLAVNLAGLGGIAVARRTARDEAGRAFADETAARGRAIEGVVSAIRADLAFLAASSPVGRLDQAADGPATVWRRAGAESALLLFLRTHPEIVRVVVRSPRGERR